MSNLRLPARGDIMRLLLAHPLVGAGIALLLRSGLGSAPWDVFHFGLHRATGLSVGAATNLTALTAILLAMLFGVRPGLATAANALLLGVCVDAVYGPLPAAGGAAIGFGYQALGTVLIGLGTGLYMSAELGNGPRDSLMVALARRGWPIVAARTSLEAGALAAGWLLGGPVGVGTVLFALAIGPTTHWGITLFAKQT